MNSKNTAASINMKKTFTVTDILFNGISRNKGTIEYYLEDERGNERKVTAIAVLGFRKKIKRVNALCQREIPLVEVLADIDIDQTITLDFTEFNKTPRIFKNPVHQNHLNNMAYDSTINGIFPDASRIPMLLTLVVLGSMAVFVFGVYTN